MSTDLCKTLASQHIEYAVYSGHFFAQLGEFHQCLELPYSSAYYIANFVNNRTKASATMNLGLCLPSQCTQEYIQNIMNEELVKLNPMVQALLGIPLAVGSVEVNPQDHVYDKSGWFYFTIIMLILLVLMGILAFVRGKLTKKKQKHSQASKIVQSFNPQDSLKIFQYKHNYLNVFNGIKTFSMLWVVFGHLFSLRLKYDVNIAGIPSSVEQFFYVFVVGAFLAVDVFFFIGGFLVAYSFMRQKSKSLLKYPMAVVHRLLRFWPSYIVVILLYYSIQIHTGSGPMWGLHNTLGQIPDCAGGWKALLFVDNLVDNGEHMCLPWGWYLQNDMQIFVFSMLFIMIYMKNRIAGYISIGLMMSLGLGLNIYEVIVRDIHHVTHLIDFVKWQDYFVNIYIKPWIRCPPYLLGLTLGLLHMEYLEVRKKLKDHPEDDKLNANLFVKIRNVMLKKRWVAWLSQIMGLAFMITTVVIPHDMQKGNKWPEWAHGVYLSFEKISFTFGIYLLVLPTLIQIPNKAFFVLDTKFFNFTGKISFWVYLCHFMVLEKIVFGWETDFYYSAETVIPLFFSISIISLFFGFLGTMLVEVPFSKLEKMLFSVLLKKKKKDDKQIPRVRNPESVLDKSISSIISSTNPSTLGNNSTLLSEDQLQSKLLPERTSIQHEDE